MISTSFKIFRISKSTFSPVGGLKHFAAQPSSRKKKVSDVSLSDFSFHHEAISCLDHIERALKPIMECNSEYTFERNAKQIVMDTGSTNKGIYKFMIDHENQCITINSPTSGYLRYIFDEESKQWLSSTDSHDMRGLITRDILRHAKGCPAF
jgi:frataxin-like iron-binding protein CyaY